MREIALKITYDPDLFSHEETTEFQSYIGSVGGDKVFTTVYFHPGKPWGKRVLAWRSKYTEIKNLQDIAIELDANFANQVHHVDEESKAEVLNSDVFDLQFSLYDSKCMVKITDKSYPELEPLIAENLGNLFATRKLYDHLHIYYENVENGGGLL